MWLMCPFKRHSGEEWEEEEEQEELGVGGSRGLEEVATRRRGDATGWATPPVVEMMALKTGTFTDTGRLSWN